MVKAAAQRPIKPGKAVKSTSSSAEMPIVPEARAIEPSDATAAPASKAPPPASARKAKTQKASRIAGKAAAPAAAATTSRTKNDVKASAIETATSRAKVSDRHGARQAFGRAPAASRNLPGGGRTLARAKTGEGESAASARRAPIARATSDPAVDDTKVKDDRRRAMPASSQAAAGHGAPDETSAPAAAPKRQAVRRATAARTERGATEAAATDAAKHIEAAPTTSMAKRRAADGTTKSGVTKKADARSVSAGRAIPSSDAPAEPATVLDAKPVAATEAGKGRKTKPGLPESEPAAAKAATPTSTRASASEKPGTAMAVLGKTVDPADAANEAGRAKQPRAGSAKTAKPSVGKAASRSTVPKSTVGKTAPRASSTKTVASKSASGVANGCTPINLGFLSDFVGFHLRLAQDASYRAFARFKEKDLVKPGRFPALAIIHLNPGISQSALGRAIARDKSTVSPLIKDLQKNGFISRKPSPNDRRSVTLNLTRKGERVLERLHVRAREHENDLDRLVGGSKGKLVGLLDKITAALTA